MRTGVNMSRIRQKSVAYLLVVLLLHVTLACTTSPKIPPAGTRFDGETMFRGLFFGHGPVAKYFPEIWDRADVRRAMAQADMSAATELENRILAEVRSKDAAFLDRFATEMQSGDHLRVRAALDDAGRRLQQAAETMKPTRTPDVSQNAAFKSGNVLHLVLYIYEYVAYFVYLWVWVYFWTPETGAQSYEARPQLSRDVLVDRIVTRLYVGNAR